MEGLGQYVLSVVAGALICGIVCGIGNNDIFRLLCGFVLTIVVLNPITCLELPSLPDIAVDYRQMGEDAAQYGTQMASNVMTDIIKTECEAYILDKATEREAVISVAITVDENMVPISAVLSGSINSDTQKYLEEVMETDLGIAKENQEWTR